MTNAQRNLNTLPGAIGSSGAFDSYGVAMTKDGQEKTPSKHVSSSSASKKHLSAPEQKKSEGFAKSTRLVPKKKGSLSPSKKIVTKASGKLDKSTGREATRTKTRKNALATSKGRVSSSSKARNNETPSSTSLKSSSEEGNEEEVSKEESEESSGSVVQTGSHPMNRKMEELQVAGGTGPLEEKAVRAAYRKLVKAYLAPFAKGIKRRSFFEVLRRKTYSLTPPGANKGTQTILFQIIDKRKLPPLLCVLV